MGWLALLVILAAALIAAVVATLHYRQEAAMLHQQLHAAARHVPPHAAKLAMSTDTVALPAPGELAGEVTVFAVRSPAGQLQVIVTARITGGRPDSRYELSGGDCGGVSADHAWAWGTTDSHGSVDITGHAWTVFADHEYYIIVDAPGPYRGHSAPALHGHFGPARGLSAVHNGYAPCAP